MNEHALHFLFDIDQRQPLETACVLIMIPLILLFLVIAAVRRFRMSTVAATLWVAFFVFSQIFPENRDQAVSLGLLDAVFCSLLAWWWCTRAGPRLREKLHRS